MSPEFVLLPPLGFARVGPSSTPVDVFHWGPNDNTISGTGATSIASKSEEITFFDKGTGIRPVDCTFELWISEHGGLRPATANEFDPLHVLWRIQLSNLKAFYRTQNVGDQVHADLTLRPGGDEREVAGSSPECEQPLVPKGECILFGRAQAAPADEKKPYRLRFKAPRGLIYAPRDIEFRTPDLKDSQMVRNLNPDAAWCNWKGDESREFLKAISHFVKDVSTGLMDDTCDGFVRCHVRGRPVTARLAVTPPYMAPDRRHLISVADGLKDREDRDIDADLSEDEKDQLALDIFERAFETLGVMNLDSTARLLESRINSKTAHEHHKPWFPGSSGMFDVRKFERESDEKFPLTEHARRRHKQFLALEVLKRHIRQRPDLLKQVLRPPLEENRFYDQRMPPFQRGSDARPLHVTRRQYEFLIKWADKVAKPL